MNDPLKVVNSTKLKVNPYGDKLDLLRGLTTMFDPPPSFRNFFSTTIHVIPNIHVHIYVIYMYLWEFKWSKFCRARSISTLILRLGHLNQSLVAEGEGAE